MGGPGAGCTAGAVAAGRGALQGRWLRCRGRSRVGDGWAKGGMHSNSSSFLTPEPIVGATAVGSTSCRFELRQEPKRQGELRASALLQDGSHPSRSSVAMHAVHVCMDHRSRSCRPLTHFRRTAPVCSTVVTGTVQHSQPLPISATLQVGILTHVVSRALPARRRRCC